MDAATDHPHPSDSRSVRRWHELGCVEATLATTGEHGYFPTVNPTDIFKAQITSDLRKLSGVDAQLIYDSLQWTATLEHGDLHLPVPRLQIKGEPPAELAKNWAEEVRPEVTQIWLPF